MSNSFTLISTIIPLHNSNVVEAELKHLNDTLSAMSKRDPKDYNDYEKFLYESYPDWKDNETDFIENIHILTVDEHDFETNDPVQLKHIEIISETSVNLDEIGFVLALLIKEEPENTYWRVEYANTCDRMLPGEFGGGVILINQSGYGIWSTVDLVNLICTPVSTSQDINEKLYFTYVPSRTYIEN